MRASASRMIPVALALALAGTTSANPVLRESGKASIYADVFEGRKTASGKRFRQKGLTAASRTIPLGSRIRVTNPETGDIVRLEVTDRGPFVKGRILDLSKAAADRLNIDADDGVVPVDVEVVASDQPTPALRRIIADRWSRGD